MSVKQQFSICRPEQVPELGKYSFNVLYRGAPHPALLVRFHGEVYGYLNQCVHMPRTLDCENSNIFDDSGRYLQCSMHSICYNPVSGESLSEICLDKKLTALKIKEEKDWIYLVDKRAVIGV